MYLTLSEDNGFIAQLAVLTSTLSLTLRCAAVKFYTLDDSVMFLLTRVDDAHHRFGSRSASTAHSTPHSTPSGTPYSAAYSAPHAMRGSSGSGGGASVFSPDRLRAASTASASAGTAASATAPAPGMLPRVNSACATADAPIVVPPVFPATAGLPSPPLHKRASSDTLK
jgi:hypothetical protein